MVRIGTFEVEFMSYERGFIFMRFEKMNGFVRFSILENSGMLENFDENYKVYMQKEIDKRLVKDFLIAFNNWKNNLIDEDGFVVVEKEK